MITIIGILIALLLPAVQAARESARRLQCSNNLKQIGLAILNYEEATGLFPPSSLYDYGYKHGWVAFILPYLEQQAVADRYHWDDGNGNIIYWNNSLNHKVIRMPMAVFNCPSTPGGWDRVDTFTQGGVTVLAACTDYAAVQSVKVVAVNYLVSEGLIPPVTNYEGILFKERIVTMAEVRDGASHTLFVVEDAGRPYHWVTDGPGWMDRVDGGAWAAALNACPLDGYSYDGKTTPGFCPFNCNNNNEGFAFHPGGMNAVFADGSVQFLPETMDIAVYVALITRENGEIIPANAF